MNEEHPLPPPEYSASSKKNYPPILLSQQADLYQSVADELGHEAITSKKMPRSLI